MPAMNSALQTHCGSGFSREFCNSCTLFAAEAAPTDGGFFADYFAGMARSYGREAAL